MSEEKQETGYVYIMTNDAFKDDIVKIGMTGANPDGRAAELDNTAVPSPFNVYAVLKTDRYREVEKFVHRNLDRLTEFRIRPNREFFRISPEEAYSYLEDLLPLLREGANLSKTEEKAESEEETARRRSNSRFDRLGLKPGDVLALRENPAMECKMVDGRNKVESDGEIYSLTAWCVKAGGRGGYGFEQVTKKGETMTLWEKRIELEELGRYED